MCWAKFWRTTLTKPFDWIKHKLYFWHPFVRSGDDGIWEFTLSIQHARAHTHTRVLAAHLPWKLQRETLENYFGQKVQARASNTSLTKDDRCCSGKPFLPNKGSEESMPLHQRDKPPCGGFSKPQRAVTGVPRHLGCTTYQASFFSPPHTLSGIQLN